MYQITQTIYEKLTEKLLNILTPTTIFSNQIEIVEDDVIIQFTATIVPYYREEILPEGEISILYDIVPVWWELQTTTNNGVVINDFDFKTLKYILCQID